MRVGIGAAVRFVEGRFRELRFRPWEAVRAVLTRVAMFRVFANGQIRAGDVMFNDVAVTVSAQVVLVVSEGDERRARGIVMNVNLIQIYIYR